MLVAAGSPGTLIMETRMYSAKIIADSVSEAGARITTMEVVFPRIVLAEFNTHRMFSRNSASSRAIPVEKMIKAVIEHPYVPSYWGKNQKGMQSEQEVDSATQGQAERAWLFARDQMVDRAKFLLDLGIHKQFTNRLLEPFMWHTVIVTATEWSNFFNLRNHPAAHPDIRIPAQLMQQQYQMSTPKLVKYGDWHLPYIQDDELEMDVRDLVKISSGRCARVSYLTHAGIRDPQEDVNLCGKLLEGGHMSPLEHPATPANNLESKEFFNNFKGWIQYRWYIPGEDDILGYRKEQNG